MALYRGNSKNGSDGEGKARALKPLGRVMVVEDDGILAMALEDAFLRAGTKHVNICATMQASKDALDTGPRPDAMVLDVHLADRDDGWALAELVTMLGLNPPRIAFSTGSPEDIPPKIAAMGMVFEKPYNPEELVRHLTEGKKRGLISRLLG